MIAIPEQLKKFEAYPMFVNGVFWKLFGPTNEAPPDRLPPMMVDLEHSVTFVRHKAYFSSGDTNHPEVEMATSFIFYGVTDSHIAIGDNRQLIWQPSFYQFPPADGKWHSLVGRVMWKITPAKEENHG